MPRYTQHYGLGIKLANEPLSAALDRQRFTIIDNEIAFLTDLIGDGRIDGWHLSGTSPYTLRVGGGMGLIDRFLTRTFGPLDVVFAEDGDFFVYMLRKQSVIGGFSDYSTLVTYQYVDNVPPAAPANLTVASLAYNSVVLVWTANPEPDVDHYDIYRSTTNLDWGTNTTPVGSVTTAVFADAGLGDGTLYYYRVVAVDETGNRSAVSARTAMTQPDLRVPADPTTVRAYAGDGVLQAAWLKSTDDFVTHYLVTCQQVDVVGSPVGSPQTAAVDAATFEALFTGLTNNQPYKVTVQSETKNSVLSAGVTVNGVPTFNAGPNEVLGVTLAAAFDGRNVTLTVNWTPPSSPPPRYVLTVTENGSVVSDRIITVGASRALMAYPVTAGGVVSNRPVLEDTAYEVRVQGEDAGGADNVGIVGTLTTSKFTSPEPPAGLTVSLFQNQYLRVGWTGTPSAFDHYELTLVRTDAAGLTDETILSSADVGRAQVSYVTNEAVLTEHTYTATLTAVDHAGNASDPVTASLEEGLSLSSPQTPEYTVFGNVGYATVNWAQPGGVSVKHYKVYRADYNGFVNAADYTLLDTFGPESLEFDDYAVTHGHYYAYVVSVVDVFDNESLGPGTGDPSDFTIVQVSENDQLSVPTGFAGSQSGPHSFTLTWTADAEFFDGYQIFRSVGNLHSWTLVGVTDRSVTTFTDTSILLKGGVGYNYIIRKFRNEGDVFVSASGDLPPGAISLGAVTVSGGLVLTDESAVVEIKNLHTPVVRETQARLRAHRHFYLSDSDDRRINLSTDWEVTDWATDNSFTYTTAQDISETTTETVYVNGQPTGLLYDIDRSLGTITFEEGVDDTTSTLAVVFHGIEETQGELPADRLRGVPATHVTKGVFDERLLPPIDHEGRSGERLLPFRYAASSSDRIRYNSPAHSVSAGDTFFDICPTGTNGVLLAGVSNGVWKSEDNGTTWDVVLTTVLPVTKVYHAAVAGRYVALAGNLAYLTSGGLADWNLYDGMEAVNVVRSVVEDTDGYIYAATDLGVYSVSPEFKTQRWVAKGLLSYKTTNCYCVFYEPSLAAVVASNEVGLFFTANRGQTWTLWSAFHEQRVVHDVAHDEDVIYLLTERRLYRKADGEGAFVQVGALASAARKMARFGTRLYVATEQGVVTSDELPLFVSSDTVEVTFANILPQLGEGGRNYVVTALGLLEDRLLFGMDQRLYSTVTHGLVILQYEGELQTATVYLNGVERSLGVSYNANWISFEDRLSPSDVAEFSPDYVNFYTPNGGWAADGYLSPVTVYANGVQFNDPTATLFTGDAAGYSAVTPPDVNSRNSNPSTATTLAASITTKAAAIGTNFNETTVASLVDDIVSFNSEVDVSIAIPIPPVTLTLVDADNAAVTTGTVDAANGTFAFPQLAALVNQSPIRYWKYSQLTADISGVAVSGVGDNTHERLDDLIECVLSGLPAGLAKVKQVNEVENALYLVGQFPTSRPLYSPTTQVITATGCGGVWYDRFNSSVDYNLRYRNDNVNVSLDYPSCVLCLPGRDEVWAGGLGGVVAIAIDGLAVSRVFVPPDGGFVRSMMLDGVAGLVYVLTDRSLYEIALADLSVSKDDGFGLPSGLNSVIQIHNNLVVGSASGAYIKRPTKAWELTLPGTDVHVDFLGDLALAHDSQNNVSSSQSGEGWTAKGSMSGTVLVDDSLVAVTPVVNQIVKFTAMYLATTAGLFTDGSTFYSKEIRLNLVNLNGSTSTPNVNDIATDGSLLVAGSSDGSYYSYVSGDFVQTDTGLETVHKVALVDGDIWLFGFDKLLVVSSGAVVKLATGNRLTWQT